MIVTEETMAAAQAVVDYIIEHPEQHDQRFFVGVPSIKHDGQRVEAGRLPDENICGTTMCIAGTAVYTSRSTEMVKCVENGFEPEAAEILGLNEDECDMLFFTMDNNVALDMTIALAHGDSEKFYALYKAHENLEED